MDAATAGLIGSLGGVALGFGLQWIDGQRGRRWAVEDRDVQREAARLADLRSHRLEAYAELLQLGSKAMDLARESARSSHSTDKTTETVDAFAEQAEYCGFIADDALRTEIQYLRAEASGLWIATVMTDPMFWSDDETGDKKKEYADRRDKAVETFRVALDKAREAMRGETIR